MNTDITITLFQPDLAWQDKNSNLLKFEDFFQKMESKTDLMVLPEMFNTGFVVEPRALAEDINGPTVEWMAKQAEKLIGFVTCIPIIL
jgi:predicted amidohydrolase